GIASAGVLPSTIAYTSIANTFTAQQIFTSSVSVNNAATLGAAGQAVTISSNLVVNGILSGNGSGLTNLPTSAALPGSTNYIQVTNALQASSIFYASSGTVNSFTVGTSIA